MRTLPAAALLPLLAGPLAAQTSVASDLWRVAAGTLVVPAALAEDGASPMWTPAVVLRDQERYRFGVEAIHSPADVGVAGGIVAFTARAGARNAVSLTYGRMGVGNVGYTETSPELVGSLDIYNQTVSLGVGHGFSHGWTGGAALRYLSGQLAFASHSQFGLDVGAQYEGLSHLRFGVTTHFFDAGFSSESRAASYSLGAEYRSGGFQLWGARGMALLRYGVTASAGDDTQQLLSAGLALGTSLSIDAGAARENTAADAVWRSRLGLGIGAGRYTVRIARDGGVNDFGATYRFGLTAVFK